MQCQNTYSVCYFVILQLGMALKYATKDMFKTFRAVEDVVDSHFTSPKHIFVRDSYEKVLSKIGEISLIPISCEKHPATLPYLIMEYVQLRFHFEANRYQNLHLSRLNASIVNHKKLSTVVSAKVVKDKCDK